MERSRILIVEDDQDTSEMLRVYFEAQGYEVLTASEGGEAIECCHHNPPDLMILDVRLPDVDGYTVCKQLQADLRTARIPIIFLTEMRERNSRIAGLKLGAVDYTVKPFDMQELRLRVRNILRRGGGLISPVTNLPGERLIASQLALLLEKEGWALLRITINGLDAFNETYGFVAGDDVLRAVALILRNLVDEIGTLDDFVGHLGGPQFVVITVYDRARALQERIRTHLDQSMKYFYPVHDRTATYVESGSSFSHKGPIPAMSVNVELISEEQGPFADVERLREAVAAGVARK
jgi:PleD family two-component response regulator